MTLATRVFYRNIHFLNRHNIPASGPVLLIANHPGSLMDAALLGLLLNRPVHFFARGDLFRNRFIHRLLNALHMHPIHHHQLNRSSLGINDDSFDIALNLLKQGEMVLFFPEGFSHAEYYLLPFKKGTFRLALQAMEKNEHPTLPIVPIGFHYTHPTAVFSSVWLKAGPPVETRNFFSAYQSNPTQAIRKLTETALAAIQELTIQTEQSTARELFQILQLYRICESYQNASPEEQWNQEKCISRQLLPILATQQHPLQDYNKLLQAAQIRSDWPQSLLLTTQTAKKYHPEWVLAIPGLVLHAPPLLLAKWIADTKVRRIDFYAWILVAAAALLDIGWLALVFLTVSVWHSLSAGLVFLSISILTGFLSWKYAPYLIQRNQLQQAKKIPGSTLKQLREVQDQLIASVKSFLF